jgi:RNA polymerase sigma-70 factor (ECF subfamily)
MGWISEEAEARLRAGMTAAQRGDAVAYERLLSELIPLLRSFVGARLREDPAAVEDVVQNVLLAVHRARHTYRAERPFAPWLAAVARNAATDHQRSRGRRRLRELPLDDVEPLADEAGPEPRPGAAGLSPELRAALERLPASQREAVELLQVHGLSVAEAAVRAGVKPGALKVRAHRGYTKLRQLLAPRDGETS